MLNYFLIAAAEYNEYFSQGLAFIGAAFAIMTAGLVGLGQALAAAKAVEAVGRQPEAQSKIQTTMIIGQLIAETSGIYALIIAFILSGK